MSDERFSNVSSKKSGSNFTGTISDQTVAFAIVFTSLFTSFVLLFDKAEVNLLPIPVALSGLSHDDEDLVDAISFKSFAVGFHSVQ